MRAIIPVYIESNNLIIKSANDVELIKEEKPKIYNKLILSRELVQFFYGFAMEKEREEAINEYSNLIGTVQDDFIDDVYINNTITDAVKRSFVELLPKKYSIKSLPDKIHFMGYHRQKTVIYLEEDLIIDAQDIKFSYVSFIAERKDLKIIISHNTKVKFSNVIFGECEVIIKDNARCWFSNVSCNGATRAIVQQGEGRIEETDGVIFNKNKYNYYIENFYSLTMKNIDRENLSEIENLILYSYIENFFIEKDIDLSGIGKLHFINKINFKAIYPHRYYHLTLPETFISNNIHIDQNIIVKGNIVIKEVENRVYSLGIIVGGILIDASSNVRIANTCLVGEEDKNDYLVEIVNSSVVFDKVYAQGEEKVAKALNSNLTVVNSTMNNIGSLCHYIFTREDEDNIFREENICNVLNSSISAKSLVTADKEIVYPIVNVERSNIIGVNNNNTIDCCRYIKIFNSKISNPYGCAVYLKGVEALIEKSNFTSSKIGIKVDDNSFVVMKNTLIEKNIIGINIFNATLFQKDANLFRNNQVALALSVCDNDLCYEKIVFYYQGTIFKNNIQDFKRNPGALTKKVEDNWDELIEKISNEYKNNKNKQ